MTRTRRSLLDQDEKKWVCDDGEEVAQEQAGVDAGVDELVGYENEVGHDEVGERMADGDNDEEPPDTEPGGHGGKDKALYEEGDEAVDRHDDADLLG